MTPPISNLDRLGALLEVATARPWAHYNAPVSAFAPAHRIVHDGRVLTYVDDARANSNTDFEAIVAVMNLASELIAVARAAAESDSADHHYSPDCRVLMRGGKCNCGHEALKAALAALEGKRV